MQRLAVPGGLSGCWASESAARQKTARGLLPPATELPPTPNGLPSAGSPQHPRFHANVRLLVRIRSQGTIQNLVEIRFVTHEQVSPLTIGGRA